MDGLADDIKWDYDAPSTIPYSGARRGKTEVLGFCEAISTKEENQLVTMKEFVGSGDQVAIFGRYTATAKSSGIRYDVAIAHFWEMRDGKAIRFQNYSDTASRRSTHRRRRRRCALSQSISRPPIRAGLCFLNFRCVVTDSRQQKAVRKPPPYTL